MVWKISEDGGMDFDAGFNKSDAAKKYEELKEKLFSTTGSTLTFNYEYPEVTHRENNTIGDIINGVRNKNRK